MIKQLEDVLALVQELPEKHQKRAAQELRWVMMRAEEEMTMTPEEIRALRRLESWRKVTDCQR